MGVEIVTPEVEIVVDDPEPDEDEDEPESPEDDAAAKMRRGHEDKQLARTGDKSAA